MEQETQVHPDITSEKKSSISTAAAIITAAVIIGLALIISFAPRGAGNDTTATTEQGATPPAVVSSDIATIRPTDFVLGDITTATVAIIEYSDSDCPYCQRFHPTLQQAVKESNGTVVAAYRFFPLSIHPNARTEALALKCVGDLGGSTAFWNYLDTVVNTTLKADKKSNELLTTLATQQGIDAKTFSACIANPATAKAVDADTAEASAIGAQGTPYSLVVNLKTGKQATIPGAYPIEDVKKTIESVL